MQKKTKQKGRENTTKVTRKREGGETSRLLEEKNA